MRTDCSVVAKLGEAMSQFEYARAMFGREAALEVDGIVLAEILNMILACAQSLADWPTMLETSPALIAIEPSECDPWIRLAIALKHTGDLPGASQAVLHAIELDPDDSDARYEAACQLAEPARPRRPRAGRRGRSNAVADEEALLGDDELASLRALPRFQS